MEACACWEHGYLYILASITNHTNCYIAGGIAGLVGNPGGKILYYHIGSTVLNLMIRDRHGIYTFPATLYA